MDINPVKLHTVPKKTQIDLEEKHTKLKSCVADTFAINEDNLSDDKSCVRDENVLILNQKLMI